MIDVSIRKVSDKIYEIYGIVEDRFIRRQYIGYTEEQAKEAFAEAIEEGEL